MANHKSAIKRIRQIQKRTVRNRYWRSTLRTAVKRVRVAVEAGDAAVAQTELRAAVRTIDRVATKGVIHKRQASRRVSRLTLAVNRMAAQEA